MYLRHREDARAFIASRIALWQEIRPFTVGRVSIKNHSRIWGSCSSLGNLNFNWRLVRLPVELADYVVVHELCHTIEHNHSRRFWMLVESLMPGWRARRSALRRYHPRLS
jgi:predicted metal-dependent hydrolase